jgi:hypothetical protein
MYFCIVPSKKNKAHQCQQKKSVASALSTWPGSARNGKTVMLISSSCKVAEVKTIITSIVNANNRKYRVNTSQRSEMSALAKGPGSAHT